MQRQTGVLAWTLGLVLLGACARPVVEEEQPDGGQNVGDGQSSEEDAEDPLPGPDDAGEPDAGNVEAEGGEPDAGCSDSDGDAICDADDNCPEQPNPSQADTDDDGIGDACDQAGQDGGSGLGCKPDAVPASVMAGAATLSEVHVNGGGSTANVSKGQTVSVSMHYAFAACGGSLPIPAPRSIVIGLEGSPDGDCTLLIEVPCPQAVSSNASLTLQAPSRAGAAYVVAVGREQFSCSNSLAGAQRVAALCVE